MHTRLWTPLSAGTRVVRGTEALSLGEAHELVLGRITALDPALAQRVQVEIVDATNAAMHWGGDEPPVMEVGGDLITALDPEELDTIIGHEIGHHGQPADGMANAVTFAADYMTGGRREELRTRLSWIREGDADLRAVERGANREVLVRALAKIDRTPSGTETHPPRADRAKNIREGTRLPGTAQERTLEGVRSAHALLGGDGGVFNAWVELRWVKAAAMTIGDAELLARLDPTYKAVDRAFMAVDPHDKRRGAESGRQDALGHWAAIARRLEDPESRAWLPNEEMHLAWYIARGYSALDADASSHWYAHAIEASRPLPHPEAAAEREHLQMEAELYRAVVHEALRTVRGRGHTPVSGTSL